jgi:alpha-L-rhamnosidase
VEPDRLVERVLQRPLVVDHRPVGTGEAEYAEMADWLGNTASAAWARGLWEQARDGYEDFWDPARGSYVDHIVDGERQPAMS